MNYLETKNLINPAQFGYRVGLSCEHALNSMVEKWRDALDKDEHAIAVFLDLSKAFDTLDHTLLLKKLKYYNFSDILIKLIRSYLENRVIKVKVNDQISNSQHLSLGVPQGSVLGPLLFIIYVNDFCSLPLKSALDSFVDDNTITATGESVQVTVENIQHDMLLIAEWMNNNRLILNIKKTQAMALVSTHKQGKKEYFQSINLNISDLIIPLVKRATILGVVIDNELKFDGQVENICKKVNSKNSSF